MSALTPSQLAKKMQVEAAGGTFVPPSQYRKVKKGAVKASPGMVAQYTAKKQYKDTYKRISPETEMIIDQCLDPESAAGNTTRWPNTYGKSAVYACKNVLNAAFDVDNRCAVAVYPRLRNAIYTTAGKESILPIFVTDTNFSTQDIYTIDQMAFQGPEIVPITSPIVFPGREVVLPFPSEAAGRMVYPLGCQVQQVTGEVTDARFVFTYTNAFAAQIRMTVYRYGPTMNLITSNIYTLIGSGVQVPIYTSGPGSAASCPSYLAFDVSTNGTPWAGTMIGTMSSSFVTGAALTNAVLLNHAQHMNVYDIKDTETLIDSAEKAIIISQSLLLTAQMSDINNGGALAIARVPGSTQIGTGTGSIDSSNWYEWLASLSTNNYDGASKSGGYGFYLPDDERGFFYRDVSQFGLTSQLPYLAAEFTVADTTEGAIMRIKVATIIQFTTNSSTYQLAPSPLCYEIDEIHHLLSLVNACYENDTHKAQLAAILKKLGLQVKKIVKNPDNWKKGAAMLTTLAAMI